MQGNSEIEQIREIIREERSSKQQKSTAPPLEFRLDLSKEKGPGSVDTHKTASTNRSKLSFLCKAGQSASTMPRQEKAARRISYSGVGRTSIESTPPAAAARRRGNASNASHDDSQDDYWNRDDAVKALGFAAVKLKKRMQQKIDENTELKAKVAHLEALLEEIELAREAAHPVNIREMKKMAVDKNESLILKQQLGEAQSRLEWLESEATTKFQQLETFEFELLSKNKTIDDLQEKLAAKTRHIVELEVDLKFHDNTLASCAAARRKLEESLLSWQSSLGEAGGSASKVARRFSLSKSQNSNAPLAEMEERQQKHVEQLKLLVKNLKVELSEIKKKFKSEKAEQEFRIDELEEECNQKKRKVLSLTRRLQEFEREYRGSELFADRVTPLSDSDGKSRLGFLEDRVKELEKQKARDKATISALRRELQATKEKSDEKLQKCVSSIERLGLENEAKSIRIAQLEMDSVYRGESHSSLNTDFESVEKMIHERFEQTDRLRSENETKDKKIVALRSELIHYMTTMKPGSTNIKRGSLNTDATMSVTTHSTDRSSCSSALQDIVWEAERRLSKRQEQQAAVAMRDATEVDDELLDGLDRSDLIRIHL